MGHLDDAGGGNLEGSAVRRLALFDDQRDFGHHGRVLQQRGINLVVGDNAFGSDMEQPSLHQHLLRKHGICLRDRCCLQR